MPSAPHLDTPPSPSAATRVPGKGSVPVYMKSVREVLTMLRVREDTGLPAAEAHRRLARDGYNLIPRHKPRSPLLVFLDRFRDTLVLFLVAAAVISLFLGEVADALIIAVAIGADAVLSFVQVWRTQRTLEKLRQSVQQTALVLREGYLQHVPAQDLVNGDIIEFRAGEHIPADARLVSTQGLRLQEGALTGESVDVMKHSRTVSSKMVLGNQTNMVFMGTVVMSGTGRAVVVATGQRTEFGKIAQILKTQPSPVSPLRHKLEQAGLVITWIIVALVSVIVLGNVLAGATLNESVRTAITLIVSAIPEDLTVILTIALTVGVIRILRQKGVVRELSSGETLGAATVICTDKTGTITQGVMHAEMFDFLQGDQLLRETRRRDAFDTLVLTGLALASDAHRLHPDRAEYFGSATERTALEFVEACGLRQEELSRQWRKRADVPFRSTWKYRATLCDHPTQAHQTLFVAGAPEMLLERSSWTLDSERKLVPLTAEGRVRIHRAVHEHASRGRRLMAVAVRRHMSQTTVQHDDIQELTFLGVLAISDPLRPDVRTAIKDTQAAGVAVKLITGDYPATARAVAREAGLTVTDDAVLTGAELQGLTDVELARIIDDIVVFARVEPLDKQRIVRALRAQGHVVAMTGDGVNDAVALTTADIGVAMGSGKDIAKDAADLVLLDDSFATIVAAIREGRVIRDNVRKVIAFLLATNVAEVAIFLVSQVLRLPLPLLPAQILWINLVTDGTSDIALSLEPDERNVMARAPEDPRAPLISRRLVLHIIFSGVVMTLTASILYWYALTQADLELIRARTLVFAFLAVTSLLSTWSYRSLWEPMWHRGWWQNPWILVSAGVSFLLQLAAIYVPSLQAFFETVPLSRMEWVPLIVLGMITVVLIDLRKYVLPSVSGPALSVSRPYGTVSRSPARL